jgi:filamentous hemagglutinin family protein
VIKNKTVKQITLALSIFLSFLVLGVYTRVLADIIPDNTLGSESSTVTQTNVNSLPSELVNGGATRGTALFHSLLKFNIKTGESTYFTNPLGIKDIFARITGSSISNIDGTLGVNGSANLFLINTNGFVFGKNSALDLNGSLTVTTANSIIFPEYEFRSEGNTQIPILSINIPIGLKFSNNSGNIEVNNNGFSIYQPANSLSPATPLAQPPLGLSTNPGNNISFLGSNVLFDGAVFNLQETNFNIGAVSNGIVLFANNQAGFDYSNTNEFGTIKLDNQSFISNTSFFGGGINVRGNNIDVINGSSIVFANVGSNFVEGINISANNHVTISGSPTTIIPNGFARQISGVISSAFGDGAGADVNINARSLILDKTGIILANSYGLGKGGDINLSITENLDVIETLNFPSAGSLIAGVSFGAGKSGNINILTNELTIQDGATIATDGLSSGDTGDINISANSVLLKGYNPKTLSPSKLLSLTSGTGQGGNLTINATNILVKDGGKIESSSLGEGNAGSLNINSDVIRLEGTFPAPINNRSTIGSSATLINPQTRAVYDVSNGRLNGKSGNVNIKSQFIFLNDDGLISVKNDGSGDAGIMKISANQIILKGGDILASTQGGNGGEIELFTKSLVLQNGKIIASAKGNGKGGDINIDSTLIAGNTTSLISANAVQGLGGRININTQGLIFNPENITATSDRGLQYGGNVNINFSVSNFSAKSELAQNLIFKDSQISCSKPLSALRNITADVLNMPDDRLEAFARANGIPMTVDANGKKTPWVKLQGWIPSGNGNFNTVAVINTPPTSSTVASGCRAITAKE